MVRRRAVLSLLAAVSTAGCAASPLTTTGQEASTSFSTCQDAAPWAAFQGDPLRTGRASTVLGTNIALNVTSNAQFPAGRTARLVCSQDHVFVTWEGDRVVFRYHPQTGAMDSLTLDRRTRVHTTVRCSDLVVSADSARYLIDGSKLTVTDEQSTASPYTGPLFDGDRLYVSGSGGLEALGPDGDVDWTYEHPRLLTGLASSADAVYTVAANSEGGRIAALDVDTGEVDWQTDIVGETYADPVVGRNVYVTNAGGRIFALDPADGSVRWTHDTGTTDTRVTVPAVGGERLFIADEGTGSVRALDPSDGTTRWETPIRSDVTGGTRASTLFAPVLTKESVLVASESAGITALSRTTGERRWQNATVTVVSPLAATAGAVYGATPSGLLTIEPSN